MDGHLLETEIEFVLFEKIALVLLNQKRRLTRIEREFFLWLREVERRPLLPRLGEGVYWEVLEQVQVAGKFQWLECLDLVMRREQLPFVLLHSSYRHSTVNSCIEFDLPSLSCFCDRWGYVLVHLMKIVPRIRVSR